LVFAIDLNDDLPESVLVFWDRSVPEVKNLLFLNASRLSFNLSLTEIASSSFEANLNFTSPIALRFL
jgi:hypothetical protein